MPPSRHQTTGQPQSSGQPRRASVVDGGGTSGSGKKGRRVRSKGSCLTCRVRRKACTDMAGPAGVSGSCQACQDLHIECLGYGKKRPDWFDDDVLKAMMALISPHIKSINDPFLQEDGGVPLLRFDAFKTPGWTAEFDFVPSDASSTRAISPAASDSQSSDSPSLSFPPSTASPSAPLHINNLQRLSPSSPPSFDLASLSLSPTDYATFPPVSSPSIIPDLAITQETADVNLIMAMQWLAEEGAEAAASNLFRVLCERYPHIPSMHGMSYIQPLVPDVSTAPAPTFSDDGSSGSYGSGSGGSDFLSTVRFEDTDASHFVCFE